MQSRLDIQKTAPPAYRAMFRLETYIRNSGLELPLLLLVKLRFFASTCIPKTPVRTANRSSGCRR